MRLPVLGIFYAAFLQCAVLALFSFYDRELPKALTFYQPDSWAITAIISLCLAHGAMLATLAIAFSRLSHRGGVVLFLLVYLFQTVIAVIDVSYYVAYGSYPGLQLWSNLLYSPSAVIAYVRVASSWHDAFFVSCGTLLSFVLGLRLWRECLTSCPLWRCVGLTFALHLVSYAAFSVSHPAGYRFIAREHSLPVVRWYGSLLQPPGNALSEVDRILPRVQTGENRKIQRDVKNILVIVVECLRPDHLSVYGYSRPTTPRLEADRDNLVLFPRGYSHAPSTESSFPILFTGRYRPNENPPARSVWKMLEAKGIRTAFVSSGQMRWGYLDKMIALHEVGYLFTAADASPGERTQFSSDPKDYGVDDRIALARYREFLGSLRGDDSTFSVLHLDASHYPYQEPAEFRRFTPTLGDGDRGRTLGEVRAAIGDPLLRERLLNSYDNGIGFADHLIGGVFDSLRAAKRLDDTVVFITSDHGEAFGEHDSGFHGTTLYEEQVHVPIIIRVPSALEDVRKRIIESSQSPRGLIDILPTTFELLGVANDPGFEGLSWLAPYAKPYEVLLYSGFGRKVAVVAGKQKYIFDCLTLQAFHFDLEKDPDELDNLWGKNTSSLREFLREIFPQAY